jgi:hypothetical protein
MEFEPNVVECECLRCGRKHFTFTKKINTEFFGICENCLNPKEKRLMLMEVRRSLGVKYQPMTGEKYSAKEQDVREEVPEESKEPEAAINS